MSKNGKTALIVAGANGRMGKTIINLALEDPAFELAGALENTECLKNLQGLPCPVSDNLAELSAMAPGAVVVDFTAPGASVKAAKLAAKHGFPLVIGTTGLDESQKEELKSLAQKAPIFWSANMSIGVNALLRVLPELAALLGKNYDIEIVEIHHRRKKDAPSGTALMLGEALAKSRNWHLPAVRNSCRDGIIGQRKDNEIGVQALRGGDVVGVHTCYFLGPGETMEVTHRAESRENFARGALRAAQWLKCREPGKLYSIGDMLDSGEE